MNWREHIAVNPDVCHGRACFKGTRIMVSVVLDNLAVGLSFDELLSSYPSLTTEGIQVLYGYLSNPNANPIACSTSSIR